MVEAVRRGGKWPAVKWTNGRVRSIAHSRERTIRLSPADYVRQKSGMGGEATSQTTGDASCNQAGL